MRHRCGAPSGPYHPTLNPGGLGNRVSDHVLFEPWGLDFDRDGLADTADPDDDNDGVPDHRDTAPRDADLPVGAIRVQLQARLNLIGYAAGVPPVHQSCADLIADIGPNTQRFEACAFGRGGDPTAPVGSDFPIRPGEGYLLHLREPTSLTLGDCP